MEAKFSWLAGKRMCGKVVFVYTRQFQDALGNIKHGPAWADSSGFVNVLQLPFNWNMEWKCDANLSVEQT